MIRVTVTQFGVVLLFFTSSCDDHQHQASKQASNKKNFFGQTQNYLNAFKLEVDSRRFSWLYNSLMDRELSGREGSSQPYGRSIIASDVNDAHFRLFGCFMLIF